MLEYAHQGPSAFLLLHGGLVDVPQGTVLNIGISCLEFVSDFVLRISTSHLSTNFLTAPKRRCPMDAVVHRLRNAGRLLLSGIQRGGSVGMDLDKMFCREKLARIVTSMARSAGGFAALRPEAPFLGVLRRCREVFSVGNRAIKAACLCLSAALLLTAGSGCAAVAVCGAAVGGLVYLNGEQERTYPYPMEIVWAATQAALDELELSPGYQAKDRLRGEIKRYTATGDRVRIVMSGYETSTDLKLRINTFGDKAMSRSILRRVDDYLAAMPQHPQYSQHGDPVAPPPTLLEPEVH
jgi:hypothetical protein